MLIDSHCHLTSEKFSCSEIREIITRANTAGVSQIISLGTSPSDWPKLAELSRENPEVRPCFGVHPCDVHEVSEENYEKILANFLVSQNAAAVGETGLDYYHPAPKAWSEENFRQKQRAFLQSHFNIAKSLNLNIVIHTRDKTGTGSFEDAIALARKFSDSVRSVFHCFIGTPEQAEAIWEIGGLISFTGIVTFPKADHLLEIISHAQPGSFMLETDSPYLAPAPKRGHRNEPGFVLYTAEKIAAARNESLEELANHTKLAVKEFFRGIA